MCIREKPDAAILDLGLPGGDGFVVLQRLRSSTSTVGLPVVVVTARPAQTNRALALEQGVVAFLQKPVKTPELLAALRKALATRRSRPSVLPDKAGVKSGVPHMGR